MIGKIIAGSSFAGTVGYVIKEQSRVLDAEGVTPPNVREMVQDFKDQTLLNLRLRNAVGHISLSFSPKDSVRMTDALMLDIAKEYMQRMGITDTQYLLVRHLDQPHPHCHLVYNRIGYDGKVISSQGDYKRNEIATKKLKDKYRLTYAEDKGKTNVKKLRSADRVKYEIHNAVKKALKSSKTWKEFNNNLAGQGVKLEFVKRSREIKTLNDIQGIRFTKDGLTFKASQISRDFSFAKLNARLSWNKPETEQEFEPKKSKQESIRPMEQRISLQENGLLEGGLGLFLPSDNNPQDEQIPYDELLRRRKKKKRKKRLSL